MHNTLMTTGLCLFLALPAAGTAEPVQEHNSNTIWFENWSGLSGAKMRIASPDGETTDIFAETGTPVFVLKGDVADGLYRYELRAATEEMVKNRDYDEDSVIGNDQEFIPKQYYRTGQFRVERGVIINPEGSEKELKE